MNLKGVNITCHGQLKYYGLWTGMTRWKTGFLILNGRRGDLRCRLYIDCNSSSPVRTYTLSQSTINRVICKAHMVLSLVNGDNVYFKAVEPSDEAKLDEVVELINETKKFKPGPLGGGQDFCTSVENETTPKKLKLSMSPQFTSMKENHRSSQKISPIEPQLFVDEFEEDSKENAFRGPGREKQDEQFLQRGQALKSIVTGDFYNSTPVSQRSYGFLATSGSGVKRPGLMPFNPQDSVKRPRLLSDKVSFSWQNRSVNSESKQSTALQGFSNLGNTCYMNAILQSLLGLDSFSNDVLYTNRKILRLLNSGSLYGALARLMNSRCKSTGSDLTRREMLRSIKSAISVTARRFSGYQQHDAHEFLGQVLDQLKEEVTKITKATPSPNKETKETEQAPTFVNPTQDNFEFEVLHTITCFNCREEVAKAERFNDLSVDLPQSSRRSIQDALDVFFKKEEIEYTCAKCGHSKSEVTHKFTRLPRILILHVKRYTYDTEISRRNKTGQNIFISRYLTLMSHCDESTQPPPAMPKHLFHHFSPLKSSSVDRGCDSALRRRLDYNPGYKFKHIRQLSDEESVKLDEHKEEIKQEHSTHVLTIDTTQIDEKSVHCTDDQELAKAIELSLQQAQHKEKEFGVFDQDGIDEELENVLKLSLLESEKIIASGHLEENELQKLSEEEQLELALQNSLMEESVTHVDNSLCGSAFLDSKDPNLEIQTENISNNSQSEDVSRNVCDQCMGSQSHVTESERKHCEKCTEIRNRKNSDALHDGCISSDNALHDGCISSDNALHDGCISSDNALHDGCISSDKTENKNLNTISGSIEIESENENKCSYKQLNIISDSQTDTMTVKDTGTDIFSDKQLNIISDSHTDTMAVKDTGTDLCSDNTAVQVRSGLDCDAPIIVDSDRDAESDSSKTKLTNKIDQCVSDFQFENCEKTRKSSLEAEQDDVCDKESIDLQCLEEKENILPIAEEASDWCDEFDVFGDSSLELTDQEKNKAEEDNEDGSMPVSYRLVSVVNHIGNSSFAGHYISDVYDMKKQNWFSCDDTRVSRITESDIRIKRQRTGYIFFYMLKDLFEEQLNINAAHSLMSKQDS